MPGLSKGVAQHCYEKNKQMGSSWIKHLTQEFTVEKCSLKPREPHLILQSQWRLHPVIWLTYRILLAAYTLIWCICSGVQTNHLKWCIFLTHLTYILLTAYFNLALVNFICYVAFSQKKEAQIAKEASSAEISLSGPTAAVELEGGSPSVMVRKVQFTAPSVLLPSIIVQWALQNLTCVTSLYVTVAFWSLNYTPGETGPDGVNINMHAMNSVLVLLELGMTAAPIHLAHFTGVLLYCMTYILFTLVYWAMGGTNLKGQTFIYKSLDYSGNPGIAAGTIVGTICLIMPLLQFLVWNLHILKRHMYFRMGAEDGDVQQC
ncbi:protein rolling stone-like [Amblyraja radiata]|uniref:protein rolling stone-like n=1 Tax=Amblyraja radiata TaxID=386614 RepID=UPI001402D5F1|nr:protein rolling stone-like [Amblyraja radiata]